MPTAIVIDGAFLLRRFNNAFPLLDVPAAKLARREGIDVVLDTMFAHAAPDLLQHVDGTRNCYMDVAFSSEGPGA